MLRSNKNGGATAPLPNPEGMMTIERAAKAIWLSRAKDMDKTDARILARAALEATAEPTPEMIEAGILAHDSLASDRSNVQLVWRAMHAAMMKEGT